MNKYTCIIIDDEPQAIEMLKDTIESLYNNIEVAVTYTNWAQALQSIHSHTYDIIFLDISIHDKNGMDLLRIVPTTSEVIFVTAYSNYALEAFKLNAAGYIVKPIDDTDFIVTMDKVLERVKNKKLAKLHVGKPSLPDKIGIPNNNGIEYVSSNDIIYLTSVNAYTKVVTTENMILSSYNLSKFKGIFHESVFYQVHRSYIINLNRVKRYEASGCIVMDNGDELPVARNNKDEFLALFKRVNNHL